MRTALFWVITQQVVVVVVVVVVAVAAAVVVTAVVMMVIAVVGVSYRRFGTTYRSHMQDWLSRNFGKKNFHYLLRHNPEGRSSQTLI